MAHPVKCYYCGATFDRDKEQHCRVGARRYGHAACMLREAEKDPKFVKLEIIDPTDIVECCYCHKTLSKSKDPCVMIGNGKYVHKACEDLEAKREKTDKEKLEEYIKKLFNTTYIDPRIQKQIKSFMDNYDYSYSGIQKSLQYFYEIKGNDISKSNGGIGIVPYVYKDAYNYHYNLWLAQQKNVGVQIDLYVPKVREITIKSPQRKVKQRKLFSFLDEEEVNGQ